MARFLIATRALDTAAKAALLTNPAAGALVSFIGWVRNHNQGRQVDRLEYEAFEALAISEGNKVLEEAIRRFGLHDAACVHRAGELAIGEAAVWVGVTSSHRAEAFEACRYIIDEIKARLPIWKREYYADGSVEWVNCQRCAEHVHSHEHAGSAGPVDEASLYARQLRVPQIGAGGQAELKAARVLVVGVGGLGSAAAQSLAGAGIGTIGLCDPDRVEASNLHRQFLYAVGDIGRPKVEAAAARLKACNPFIQIREHPAAFSAALVADYDLVLDCTDNFRGKYQANDACMAAGKTLVSASVHRWEGQFLVVDPHSSGGCLRCLWPESPNISSADTCADIGIIGAIPAMLGTLQALEAVKRILGLPTAAADHLILWDGLTQATTALARHRTADCPACAGVAAETRLPAWELDIDVLTADTLRRFRLIDLRDATERARPFPQPVLDLPLSGFDFARPPLDTATNYLAFCAGGARSRRFAAELRERGWTNIHAATCSADTLARMLEPAT